MRRPSPLFTVIFLLAIITCVAARGQELGDLVVSMDDRQQAVEQRERASVALRNDVYGSSDDVLDAASIDWPKVHHKPDADSVNALKLEDKVALLNRTVVEFERLKTSYLNVRPEDFATAENRVGALRPYLADDFPALPRVSPENYQSVLLEMAGRIRRLAVLPWNFAARFENRKSTVNKRQELELDVNGHGRASDPIYGTGSETVDDWEPLTLGPGALVTPATPDWSISNVPLGAVSETLNLSGSSHTVQLLDDNHTPVPIHGLSASLTVKFAAELRVMAKPTATDLPGTVHVLARSAWSYGTGGTVPTSWDKNDASFLVLGSSAGEPIAPKPVGGPAITAHGSWITTLDTEDVVIKSFFVGGYVRHVDGNGTAIPGYHSASYPLERELHAVFVPQFSSGIDDTIVAERIEKSLKVVAAHGADGAVRLHPRPSLYYGIDVGCGLSGSVAGMLGVSTVNDGLAAVGGHSGETVAGLYFPQEYNLSMSPEVGIRADFASHLRFVGAAQDFHVVYETHRDQRGAGLPDMGRPFGSNGRFDTASMRVSWELPRLKQVVGRDLIADVTYQGHYACTVEIYRRPSAAGAPDLTPGTAVPLTGLTSCRTWVIANPDAASNDYPTTPEQFVITGTGVKYEITRDRLNNSGDTILFQASNSTGTPLSTERIYNETGSGTDGSQTELTIDGQSTGVWTLSRGWKWWDHKAPASATLVSDAGNVTITNTLDPTAPGSQGGRYPLFTSIQFPDLPLSTRTWNTSGVLTAAAQEPWSIVGTIVDNTYTQTRLLGTATVTTDSTEFIDGGLKLTSTVDGSAGAPTRSTEIKYGTASSGLPGLPHIIKNSDGTGATYDWNANADGSYILTLEEGLLSTSSVSRGTQTVTNINAHGYPKGINTFIMGSGEPFQTSGTDFPDAGSTPWGMPTKATDYNTGLVSTWESSNKLSRLANSTSPLGIVTTFSGYDVLGRPGTVSANGISAANTYNGFTTTHTITGDATGSIVETRDKLGRLTSANTTWNGIVDELGVTRSTNRLGINRTHSQLGSLDTQLRSNDGSVASVSGDTEAFGGSLGQSLTVQDGLLKSDSMTKDLNAEFQTTWTDAWGRVRKTLTPSATGGTDTTHFLYSSPNSSFKRVRLTEPSGRKTITESDPYNAAGSIIRSGIDINGDGELGATDRYTESITSVTDGKLVTTLKLAENNGLREILRTEWNPKGNETITKINRIRTTDDYEETITRTPSYLTHPPLLHPTVSIHTHSSKGWDKDETLNNLGLTASSDLSGTGIPSATLTPAWRADGSLSGVTFTAGGDTHSATFKDNGTLDTLDTLAGPGGTNIPVSHTISGGVESLTVDGVTTNRKLDGTETITSGPDIIGKTNILAVNGNGFQETIHPAIGSNTITNYNSAGASTAKNYAAGVGEEREFLPGGLLKEVTLARGGKLAFSYSSDGAKDLTSAAWPTVSSGDFTIPAATQTYSHDRAGRVNSIGDFSGVRSLAYQNGRPKETAWTAGPLAGYRIENHRDASGRDTGFELYRGNVLVHAAAKNPNGASGEIANISSGTLTATYERDTAHHLTKISRGSVTQNWLRGLGGRILSASSSVPGAPAFGYTTFAPQGRRLNCTTPTTGGAWIYQYTNGKLTSAVHPILGTFTYQFDAIGRRTDKGSANTSDLLNRTLAWTNTQNKTLKVTAHPSAQVRVGIGNATPSVINGFTGNYNYAIPSPGASGGWVAWNTLAVLPAQGDAGANPDAKAEQSGAVYIPPINETFTYDAAGNRESTALWDCGWDAKNQLVRARTKNYDSAVQGFDVTNAYDSQNRRFSKKVTRYQSGGIVEQKVITFIHDGNDLIYEREQLPSGLTTCERKYVWGPDISGTQGGAGGAGGLLLIRETKGSSTIDLYPLYDGTGHVVALADSAGNLQAEYAYGPFGEPIYARGPHAQSCPFRYATKYFDVETGLYDFGRRPYDPITNQWLAREPLGESESLNLYSYCHNDPVNNVDKLGLASVSLLNGGPLSTTLETLIPILTNAPFSKPGDESAIVTTVPVPDTPLDMINLALAAIEVKANAPPPTMDLLSLFSTSQWMYATTKQLDDAADSGYFDAETTRMFRETSRFRSNAAHNWKTISGTTNGVLFFTNPEAGALKAVGAGFIGLKVLGRAGELLGDVARFEDDAVEFGIATQLRNSPGIVSGGDEIPDIVGRWLRGTDGNAGKIPGQIARQLEGETFKSFDEFRGAFWKTVSADPELSTQFSVSNITRMTEGLAPIAVKSQQYGGNRSYILHHYTPIHAGGGVFDLSNLQVVTPRFHQDVLSPAFHFRNF